MELSPSLVPSPIYARGDRLQYAPRRKEVWNTASLVGGAQECSHPIRTPPPGRCTHLVSDRYVYLTFRPRVVCVCECVVPVFVALRDTRVRGLLLVVKSSCHESLSLLWHGHHRPQGAAQAGQCTYRPSIVNPDSAAQSLLSGV